MATALSFPRRERLADDLTRLSDEALVAATRTTSQAAALLYGRHEAALARFCRSILHDPHEAGDAAQDAWLRALTALSGGAEPSNFKAWLFGIARNRCTDSFRVVRTQGLDGVAEDLVDPAVPVAERLDQRSRLDALWADLRTLSEAQRSAFLMTELHGMSNDQVAAAMRRSSESCRSLAADARAAVRERQAGRDTDCHAIRAQLHVSRRHSRLVDAHLEVCRDCHAEARRERGRRLVRSLAIAPIPLPLLPRLRAAHAWLSALTGSGSSLPERAAGALAATALAATIGLGAGGGEPAARQHVAPAPAAVARALPQPPAVAAATPRPKARPAGGAAARPHRQAGSVRPAPPRTARRGSGMAPQAPAAAPAPNPVRRTARQVADVVRSTLPRATQVAATVPSTAAVVNSVEQVTAATTGALGGFTQLPNS